MNFVDYLYCLAKVVHLSFTALYSIHRSDLSH